MSLLKKSIIGALICCAALAFISISLQKLNPAFAAGTDEGTLKELLLEVQRFRQEMQASTAKNSRIQIEFQRYRLQQETVNQVTRDLEDARFQLAELSSVRTQTQEMAVSLERQLDNEANPVRREDINRDLQTAKAGLELHKQRQQKYEERATQLTSSLLMEQAKLAELKEALDTLELELEKTSSSKK